MRNTAWIWAMGCAAWTADGIMCLHYPNKQHAELAFALAAMFAVAWVFYSRQSKGR
jgi:hypothetical protein